MTASAMKKAARLRRIVLVLMVLVLLVMLLERNLTRIALTLAAAKAEVLAVQALNQAADELIDQGVSYDSLVKVTLGEDGSVRLLQSDAAGMNSLAARASLTAQEKLNALADQSVAVPLGSALGVTLLAGAGPKISVHRLPVGAVVTAYETAFTSAGINQTRHRVLLTMTAQVRLVLPTGASSVEAVTQVAVAESIIVGQVPDSFVNVGDDSDLLNLVP